MTRVNSSFSKSIMEKQNKLVQKKNKSKRILNYHTYRSVNQKGATIYNLLYKAMSLSSKKFKENNLNQIWYLLKEHL